MGALELLPERMASPESKFAQFRVEVRGEFSAMRMLHEDVIARLQLIQNGQKS